MVKNGTLSACGATWCLSGAPLDLGPSSKHNQTAAADFDGDGTTESNRDELTGLQGRSVSVKVKNGTTPMLVVELQGRAY